MKFPKGKKDVKITSDEVKEVFDVVCEKAGKGETILSQGGISYTIFNINKERTVFDQAAVAMYEIASNHYFSDGNKRTAILITELILNKGGYKLKSPDPSVTTKMLKKIAMGKEGKNKIKEWIKKHAIKIRGSQA